MDDIEKARYGETHTHRQTERERERVRVIGFACVAWSLCGPNNIDLQRTISTITSTLTTT